MANANYNITVGDTSSGWNLTSGTTYSWCAGCSHYCWGTCSHNHYSYWTVSAPERVYLYQVKCPNCETNNWLELDTVTKCEGCEKTLKATKNEPDYTVPVN